MSAMRLPLGAHLREMGRLAAPVVLSRTGIMTLALVNLMFLGRAGVEQVAYMAAAGVPFNVILVAGNGMTLGTMVTAAHAFGRGDWVAAGQAWRRSLPFVFGIGLAGTALCLLGEPFLRATGQDPAIAAGAGRVLRILGLSLPGHLLYLTSAYFLEAVKRPVPAVAAILIGNLVNAALNWALVFGQAGAPALGAEGSAVATTAARFAMAFALVAYVLLFEHGRFAVRRRPAAPWRDHAGARAIGYAASASAALEASAFGSMTLFAGWFGPVTLAAYAITINAWSMVFMAAVGLGIATAVRVAHAAGAGDSVAMREAGWVGLGLVLGFMAAVSALFVELRGPLAALFTTDAALRAEAAVLLGYCAWVMTLDSGKTVMMQALRGTGDTWTPTRAQFLLHFAVMIPSAWALAFPLGLGPAGLFLGIFLASLGSLGFLLWRFWQRSA